MGHGRNRETPARPNALRTTEARIIAIEFNIGEARVQWREVKEDELLVWAQLPTNQLRQHITQ